MPNPDLIPEPFAQSGDKNPIPLERAIADPVYRASWKAGFPPNTRLPKDVGGEAPDGLDFNGVLNILSQAVVFLQKGNAYQFDASLAPYPIGALVRSNDNLTTFQSTIALNSNNPNSNMIGWRVYNGSGFIVDNLTSTDGTKALSAKQGKILQDEKLAIADLVNDLTTGGEETAITAEAVKLFYQIFSGGLSRFRIPDPLDPEKPWIIQFFNSAENTNNMQANFIQTFPVAFPNECCFVIGAQHHNVFVSQDSLGLVCATYARTKTSVGIIWDHVTASSAASTRSVSILAIGK